MKIGLVLDDTLDTPDGVQQYVLQVGAWLNAQGHAVHYLVGHTERNDIANTHSLSKNMHVSFNGNSMSMPLPVSKRKLKQFLTEQAFDVLHVQMPYSPFLAGRLLLSAPRTSVVVGTFHILPYSSFVTLANRGLRLLNARSARRFDAMLAVSEPAAEFARRIYGYRCKIVPNPIDTGRYMSATTNITTLNIVFLGRLVERKGAQHLLKAIARIRENGLYTGPFKLFVGGKGPLLTTLQQFTKTNGLDDIVQFMGFIDEAAKASFLAQADIAVYPSTSGESFGIVLLEAMAAGRGVVLAGDNPGYRSVMAPFPAHLFSPTHTDDFAQLLANYLGDAAARTEAQKAQRVYVKQFDTARVGSELVTIYKQALQSHSES